MGQKELREAINLATRYVVGQEEFWSSARRQLVCQEELWAGMRLSRKGSMS